MTDAPEKKPGSWSAFEGKVLLEALRDASATLVVAIAITLLILALPVSSVGTALSQGLLTWFHADGSLKVDAKSLSPADRALNWVFVDTAEEVCGPRGKPTQLCPPYRLRTDPAALAHTLAWVRSRSPAVVILDFDIRPLPHAEPDENYEKLSAELSKEEQAPVLLVWQPDYPREKGAKPITYVLQPGDVLPASPWKGARYVPAAVTTLTSGDSLLEPELVFDTGDELERLPNVAFAAAIVARTDGPDRFALLDAYPRHGKAAHEPEARTCLPQLSKACIKAYGKSLRVMSFHDGVRGEDHTGEAISGKNYLRIFAPALGDSPTPAQRLTNAVVVIGDGRAASRDRHLGLHGEISGAELILSDARQFALTPPSPKPGYGGKVLHKLPFLFFGGISAFLVAWFTAWRRFTRAKAEAETAAEAEAPVEAIAQGSAKAAKTARLRADIKSLWHAMGHLLLHSAATAAAIGLVLLAGPPHPGSAPDFITPWVALGGEVFFELVAALAALVRNRFNEKFNLSPNGH